MGSLDAFFDELEKIADAKQKLLQLAAKHPGKALAAAIAGGAGLYRGGSQAYQDWMLGRTIRKQSKRR